MQLVKMRLQNTINGDFFGRLQEGQTKPRLMSVVERRLQKAIISKIEQSQEELNNSDSLNMKDMSSMPMYKRLTV